MNEKLIHYSYASRLAPRSVKQTGQGAPGKPDGLWVSVGDAWKIWCEAESFSLDKFTHAFEIKLRPDANILRLSGSRALWKFTRDFGKECPCHKHTDIDWSRVAEKFDGIIIAPYVWSERHKLLWYYGWDCASGCIWNVRCIEPLILPA